MKKKINDVDESKKVTHKGIYLLPNLFTTAALFAGFYAIVAAMKWQFSLAAVSIFVAMLADSLDGRIARLTNTTSAFGREYDSLSDMVTFGIAPALVMYNWGLHFLGKVGWLIAFLYVAAVGLRLARFNLQAQNTSYNKHYFYGLPCPSAAGVIAGLIWVQDGYHLPGFLLSILAGLLTVGLSALLLSNILYRSFKDSDFKHKVSFWMMLFVVLIFIAIAIDPPKVLFAIFFIFALSGPILALRNVKKLKLFSKRRHD